MLVLAIYCNTAFTQENTTDSISIDGKDFIKVDSEADFIGGIDSWREYLKKNLNGSVPAENGSPVGLYKVIVQFIVDIDGSVSNIEPLTKMGYGMEQEVVRILKKSGKWTPAILNGKPVKAYRKQPVTFLLEDPSLITTTSTPYTFFAGKDNELTVIANNVKPEYLYLTISHGKITGRGNGKFIVKVTRKERAIVRIYNAKKDNKEIAAVSFSVE